MEQINNFDFVESKLSCQGHFVKKPVDTHLFYSAYKKVESSNYYLSRTLQSRVKLPYVLLYFDDSRDLKKFVRSMIRSRRLVSKKEISLHIITPRKMLCDVRLRFPPSSSIILSYFDEHFVSISLFVGFYYYLRYEKHKIKFNNFLKRARRIFFTIIVDLLIQIELRKSEI